MKNFLNKRVTMSLDTAVCGFFTIPWILLALICAAAACVPTAQDIEDRERDSREFDLRDCTAMCQSVHTHVVMWSPTRSGDWCFCSPRAASTNVASQEDQ